MVKKLALAGSTLALIATVFATFAHAAVTTVVTPANTQGWSTADTRPGGAVNFVLDATSPFPDGALELTTNASTTAKAQYLHAASTTLASVTNLSYYTKRVSGPDIAAPSYQLIVQLNGTSSGFTTLVFEPYQNGTVASSTWQQWNVAAGQFWSTRSFTDGTCSVTAGGGGAPFYTLAGLKAACPNAKVIGFGVNIGSNNPSYDVYTDGVAFNDTTYDFQQAVVIVDVDKTPPTLPVHLSPANGATTTSAALTMVDWTDSTDASSTPVTYYYQSSYGTSTNPDGSFVAPAYTSGPLATSSIATPGTPEGTYYWHVRAVDAVGNSTVWTTPWSFTVSNTVTPPPPPVPTDKDQCKKGGFKAFGFKNQGQCVSSVVSHKSGTTTDTTTETDH
jgi:hypothetical protein